MMHRGYYGWGWGLDDGQKKTKNDPKDAIGIVVEDLQ